MGIDEANAVLHALRATEWSMVQQGVVEASRWLQAASPGDPCVETILNAVVICAEHRKWEVRHAVARLAAQSDHPTLERALARLVRDQNARVRDAAHRAAVRRRDWQNADSFGKQHEEQINAALDGIERRFGVPGREAVKRASAQIADTFARELYHETVRLLAPLAGAAEQLKARVDDPAVPRPALAQDAERIGRRVVHLKAVLDAMRAYSATPKLDFERSDIVELVSEALEVVREGPTGHLLPSRASGNGGAAKVCRGRLIQALTNIFINAVEAYEGTQRTRPVEISVESGEGSVSITIEDFGCGMSDEVAADARVLFSTSKATGTGFGLPLAVKIVESEHGGRLDITSRKGVGTSLRITLPVMHRGAPQ